MSARRLEGRPSRHIDASQGLPQDEVGVVSRPADLNGFTGSKPRFLYDRIGPLPQSPKLGRAPQDRELRCPPWVILPKQVFGPAIPQSRIRTDGGPN